MNQIVAQSMTGAGSATATEQSQIAALRTASLVGSNANQARLASAARSTSGVVAVAAGSKTAARSLGVILGTSATTLLRSASESLTAAVCGSFPGIVRLFGKLLSGVVTSIAVWLKSRAASLVAIPSSNSTIARATLKRLSASAANSAAGLFFGNLYLRVLASGLVHAMASAAHRFQRVLVAQGGSLVSAGRALAHLIATQAAGSGAILRRSNRSLTVTVASPAAIIKSVHRYLAAGSSFVAQLGTIFLKWKMNFARSLWFGASTLNSVLTVTCVIDPAVRFNDIMWIKATVMRQAVLDLVARGVQVSLDRNVVFGATLG